jgi:hypothetical protein
MDKVMMELGSNISQPMDNKELGNTNQLMGNNTNQLMGILKETIKYQFMFMMAALVLFLPLAAISHLFEITKCNKNDLHINQIIK